MRWNYHVQHLTPEEVKRSWANKKLMVTNAKNGNAVVVRADPGGNERQSIRVVARRLANGDLLVIGRNIDEFKDIAEIVGRSLGL